MAAGGTYPVQVDVRDLLCWKVCWPGIVNYRPTIVRSRQVCCFLGGGGGDWEAGRSIWCVEPIERCSRTAAAKLYLEMDEKYVVYSFLVAIFRHSLCDN